ncbi:hypothetical protein [Thermosipho africanus]|uniref:hypothetical protein n=1 Tax=Thermosipho africanus TaxID=2421 RepID=UPI000309E4D5|nr:hypothetical protein [Thermosipho africanus]
MYFHQWKDDFSEARNYSLKFPTCEWVLIYDADEEVKGDFSGIREFLENLPKDVNTIYLPTISYLDLDLKSTEITSTPRVFRNGTVKYENIVHNQAIYKGKVVNAPFKIYHYGYIWTRKLKKKKYERSRTLIAKMLEDRSRLSKVEELYYVAQLYKIEAIGGNVYKKYKLANELFDLMMKYKQFTPIVLEIMFTHGMDFYNKGFYDSSEKIFKETLKILKENPDPYCGLSLVYEAKKRLRQSY